nr:hypothetical protein [Tanacetum cinerariifolium]
MTKNKDDELIEESDDDVFEAGDEMDEDFQQADEEKTQSLKPDTDGSDSESSSCSKTFKPHDNYTPITERQLDTMSNLDQISKAGFDERAKLLKSLNRISETLEVDSAPKEEMNKMAESNTTISGNITNLTKLLRNTQLPKNSSRLTKITNSLKAINFPSLHQRITTIENTQVTMQADISSIKGMMTEMLYAFKGMSFSTCSGSASIPTAIQPEGEPMQIVTTTKKPEEAETEKAKEEPARVSRVIPISTVIPITRPNPKIGLIEFSSRPPLTDTILEIPISQPTGLVINITSLEQPESPPVSSRADRGKRIATDDVESPKKLIKASTIVRLDLDEPVRVPYMIHGNMYQLTNDEIQEHLDKEEKIKKVAEEAKLLIISKPELIKVVHEEALKDGIDPKILESAKEGQEFKKIQDAELKVLNREQSHKVKRQMELGKKRLEQYMWTTSSRLIPEPITDVKITICIFRIGAKHGQRAYIMSDCGCLALDTPYDTLIV